MVCLDSRGNQDDLLLAVRRRLLIWFTTLCGCLQCRLWLYWEILCTHTFSLQSRTLRFPCFHSLLVLCSDHFPFGLHCCPSCPVCFTSHPSLCLLCGFISFPFVLCLQLLAKLGICQMSPKASWE